MKTVSSLGSSASGSCSPATAGSRTARYRSPVLLKFAGTAGQEDAGTLVTFMDDNISAQHTIRLGYPVNPGVPFDLSRISARFVDPPLPDESFGASIEVLKNNVPIPGLAVALNTGDTTKSEAVDVPGVFADEGDQLDVRVTATSNAGLTRLPTIVVTVWGTSQLVPA